MRPPLITPDGILDDTAQLIREQTRARARARDPYVPWWTGIVNTTPIYLNNYYSTTNFPATTLFNGATFTTTWRTTI